MELTSGQGGGTRLRVRLPLRGRSG
jgi:hypothetical protein